jgi:hypothetical protein
MITVWLRNVGDDEDDCWVACAKADQGATPFVPSSYMVETIRLNDDLMKMNAQLVTEKQGRLRNEGAGTRNQGEAP